MLPPLYTMVGRRQPHVVYSHSNIFLSRLQCGAKLFIISYFKMSCYLGRDKVSGTLHWLYNVEGTQVIYGLPASLH
jgi:hypothetical protein